MPTFSERLAALGGGSSFADRLAALEQPKKVDIRTQSAERVKKLNAESAAAEEPGFIRSFLGEVIPSPQALGTMASAIGARGPGRMFGAWGDIASGAAKAQGEQFYEAAEAYNQGDIMGGLEHVRAGVTPLVGPALQDAREEFVGGNIGGGIGKALGVAANIAGPEAAVGVANKAKALAPAIRANAERQYAGALSKNKSVAPLVEEVAPEMLDRGIKFRDPKELSARAEDAAAAVDVDTPVLNSQHTFTTEPIVADIKVARDEMFNTVETVSLAGGKRNTLASLRERFPDARLVVQGDNVVVQQIRYPDMKGKVSRLNKLERHVRNSSKMETTEVVPLGANDADEVVAQIKRDFPDAEISIEPGWGWDRGDYGEAVVTYTKAPGKGQVGEISPETALNLRRDADYYSNPDSDRFGDVPSVRMPGDAHLASSLRREINADPAAAAANAEKSLWLDIKKVADATPQGKRIADVLMENLRVAGAGALGKTLGVPLFGELAMGAAALRILRDLPKTAQWRTASAVQKAKFAKALQSGDMAGAARAGADIVSGSAIMDNVIE